MTNEQALKPCPFCGEPNDLEVDNSDHNRSTWTICHGCGARGAIMMSHEQAVKAWNERAKESAVQPEPVAPIGEIVGTQKVGFTEIPLVMWFPKPPVLGTKLYAAQPLTPPVGLKDALPLKDQRAIEDMRQFLQMPSDEKKAAVRYLWLRDANNWTEDGLVVCSGNGEDTCYGEALDHAIDRAMLSALPKE